MNRTGLAALILGLIVSGATRLTPATHLSLSAHEFVSHYRALEHSPVSGSWERLAVSFILAAGSDTVDRGTSTLAMNLPSERECKAVAR
jgi:hypothetical protein